MKSLRTVLPLFVAFLLLPLTAVGQDQSTVSNEETGISKKSLAKLRREAFKAEEEFYSIYNDLNDDRDYDVRCFYEKPTGTRQKNHVCRARFVTKAYSSHAARNGNDLSRVANQSANSALAEQTSIYQNKMETLIAANPELQAAFIRYNTARSHFFEKREAMGKN